MVKKSWEKKVDNKGFTLVELIVVLVILAILAAILVPALLGYIDRAKGSQILLNGKSVLTAAQAEYSNAYGTCPSNKKTDDVINTDAVKKRIASTADIPAGSGAIIKAAAASDSPSAEKHDAWTVKYVAYWEGDTGVFFNGTSWEEGLTAEEAKTAIGSASGGSAIQIESQNSSTGG
jgi:prepilin-type N-terminal cleavage/methylation domain-containing protein